MVSYDCPYCNGNGTTEVIVIRNSNAEIKEETCTTCKGSGHLRNGEPEPY